MSAVLSLAKPQRIKASHRRRWQGTTGHRLYIMNNPLAGTDPTGYVIDCMIGDICNMQDRLSDINGRQNAANDIYKRFALGGNGSDKKQDSKNKSSSASEKLTNIVKSALVPNAEDLGNRGKPGSLWDDARGFGTAVLNQGISLVNASAHAPGLIGIAVYVTGADPNLIDKVHVPDKSLAGAVLGDIAFGTATAVLPTKLTGGAAKAAPLDGAAINATKTGKLHQPGYVADEAVVVRGGQNLPENFVEGTGVSIDSSGNLRNASVQASSTRTALELGSDLKSKQLGITTAADIRKIGGDVVPKPNINNPDHVLLEGITPVEASMLNRPTLKNPNPKK